MLYIFAYSPCKQTKVGTYELIIRWEKVLGDSEKPNLKQTPVWKMTDTLILSQVAMPSFFS